ncbi:MAG: hypothetical protein ACQETH_14645 [Candidatus Rifleibacteriota bacterium]
MSEKQLSDYLKKVDFSDIRVLVVGLVLLLVPVLFIFYLSGDTEKGELSRQKIKSMARRKNIFNYSKKKKAKKTSSVGKSGDSSSGWFSSESPEKKVQRELEQAFKVIKRSKRSVSFPPGTTRVQKESYLAETNQLICEGNGALENRNLPEAQKLFERAFDEARDNAFQKVYALGGLLEVYSQMKDERKYEETFQKYMDWVGKLPRDVVGGDLRESVRNAYMTLKALQDHRGRQEISERLRNSELVKEGYIKPTEVPGGLATTLAEFPAKFE